MTPIEICRDAKTPASAITEDITAILPDGRQIELYSTEEGFEADPPVRGKTNFLAGESLPLQGGLVARAIKAPKEEMGDMEVITTEQVYTIVTDEPKVSTSSNTRKIPKLK